MISSTSDRDYFSLKMDYQSISRLECFKILTNTSIQTLENLLIIAKHITRQIESTDFFANWTIRNLDYLNILVNTRIQPLD